MNAEREYYKNSTEYELITYLKKGERGAFTEIYDRSWKMLYNMVYFEVKTPEATEALLIDALSSFWNNRKKHKFPTIFPNLLKEIHHYLTLYYEQEGNDPNSRDPFNLMALKMLNAKHLQADKQIQECVDIWLFTAPDIRFDIYHLKCVEGLTHDEIAESLKMDKEEVRLEVVNILKKFEAFLANTKS